MLSVICAALLVGTALCLVPEGMARAVVRLLCGVFLAFVIVSSLTRTDLEQILALSFSDLAAGTELAAEGENMARRSRASIIKQSCEAYIMDKAAAFQGELKVEITVSGDTAPVPVAAELSGNVSPYAKGQIERILQTELGIPKENLRWTL